MGGWGGTPYFDVSFLLGYAAYGLLLSFEYLFYRRARNLPWLSGERPVRDFFLLLFFFSLAVAWHFIFFFGNVDLTISPVAFRRRTGIGYMLPLFGLLSLFLLCSYLDMTAAD